MSKIERIIFDSLCFWLLKGRGSANLSETLTDDLPAFSLSPQEYITNVRQYEHIIWVLFHVLMMSNLITNDHKMLLKIQGQTRATCSLDEMKVNDCN